MNKFIINFTISLVGFVSVVHASDADSLEPEKGGAAVASSVVASAGATAAAPPEGSWAALRAANAAYIAAVNALFEATYTPPPETQDQKDSAARAWQEVQGNGHSPWVEQENHGDSGASRCVVAARCLRKLDKPDLASAQYKAFVGWPERRSPDPETYEEIARFFEDNGDHSAADKAWYKRLEVCRGDDPAPIESVARHFEEKGNKGLAKHAWHVYLSTECRDPVRLKEVAVHLMDSRACDYADLVSRAWELLGDNILSGEWDTLDTWTALDKAAQDAFRAEVKEALRELEFKANRGLHHDPKYDKLLED